MTGLNSESSDLIKSWNRFEQETLAPTGFSKAISVASDTESRSATLQLASGSDSIFAAFGIHPLYASLF